MTPSPQEVAALVERLKRLAGTDLRHSKGWSSVHAYFDQMYNAADALTAQAARIAELERECAELRKDAARLDAVLGWTKTGWGCWWNYRKIKTRQEIDLCLTVSITSAAISAKPMEESI